MVDNSVSLNSYIKAVDPLIQVMRQCNHFYGHFALLCWKGMDWMPIIFISASLQHYWDFSRRFISWLIHISYQTTGIFLSIGRLSVAYFLITARSYRLCCPLINLTHSDNTNSPYHVKRFPDLSISTVVIWFQSFRIAECCFSWCCMVSS